MKNLPLSYTELCTELHGEENINIFISIIISYRNISDRSGNDFEQQLRVTPLPSVKLRGNIFFAIRSKK